jgi:hypothetical protein
VRQQRAYERAARVHDDVPADLDTSTLYALQTLPPRNHYRIRVRTASGKRLRLLLNAINLVVAAASDDDPLTLVPPFCDVPAEQVFHLYGFRCASGSLLEQPVTQAQLGTLDDDERADVTYHQPDRLGDVLFNWFD